MDRLIHLPLLMILGCLVLTGPLNAVETDRCPPTQEDEMGPFYRPGAPLRSVVGQGHVLLGTVKAAVDCEPIAAALIEFWMTGPDGWYDDAYRAAVITGQSGTYRFESHYPGLYASRPAHIHIRVSAEGFETLTTQYYLQPDQTDGHFDLVLRSRAEGAPASTNPPLRE
ncbi:MAG: intradiol ring-cleavage dioxygenase [Deltaproteobacteria bacterium]|jgi:protocatechuate 3,4-dioxygenase beta subunit|nr:intradiol ring-cleavage dioxygenase [Deltaproteobacteria bacterium]